MRRSVAEMIVRDPEKYAHHDRVFLNNPVVMQGMGLAPLVVLATTGKNALMLAVSVALLLTPSRMLACLLSRAFPLRDEQPAKEELEKKLLPRGLIYSGSAAVVYLAVYPILNALFGVDLLALGIYLPMLVVEPLLIYRFGRVQETMQKAVSKGLRITLGYVLLLLLLGCVREWMALGTVFGIPPGAAHGRNAGRRLHRAGHPVRHLARPGPAPEKLPEDRGPQYRGRASPEGGEPRA